MKVIFASLFLCYTTCVYSGADSLTLASNKSMIANAVNVVSLEAFGFCKSVFSFNYDYRFTTDLNIRASISPIKTSTDSNNIVELGNQFNCGILVSRYSAIGSGWEYGIGAVYRVVSKDAFVSLLGAYRFQSANGGLMFRFAFYPVLNGYFSYGPWYNNLISFGFNLGYAF